jgi:ribosomal protein L7/L12
MAMINCPECGKEISDASKSCIHCGFPLEKDAPDVQVMLKKVVLERGPTNKLAAIKIVRQVTNLGLAEAKTLVESDYPVVMNHVDLTTATEIVGKFAKEGVTAYVLDADGDFPAIAHQTFQNSASNNAGKKITCPRCGSDNVHFITVQSSQNFDKGDACCGYLLCGPLGLLCGVKGKNENKTVRKCMNCNQEF